MTARAGGTGGRPAGGVRVGDILKDRYRLLQRLAAGPRADLWTARDEILDRTVIVKVLHLEPGNVAVRDRFRNEALAVARLSHPGVLAVYDTLLEGGVTGLVLEHVEATPLSRYLHEGGPVSVAQALSIALQVADALAAAHDGGVRHGNLSTDAVWLCGDGRIKVTDFGAARTHDDMTSANPPLPAGAQEQADIRALAGILRDCLAPGDTPADFPQELAAFLAEAESPDGGIRFDSISEARALLAAARLAPAPPEAFEGETFIHPVGVRPPGAEPRAEPGGGRRGRSRATATALILVGVTAAVVVPALTGGDPPAPERSPPESPVVVTGAVEAPPTGDRSPAPVAAAGSEATPGTDEGEAVEPVPPAVDEPVAPTDPGVAIVAVRAVTFAPEANNGDNLDAFRTLDRNPATYWTTPGLSAGDPTVGGIGLEFRLAEPALVSQLALVSDTVGWEAEVYVGTGGHDRLSDWGPVVDRQVNATGTMVLGLADQRAPAVLLWIPDPRAALTNEIRIAEAIISATSDRAVP